MNNNRKQQWAVGSGTEQKIIIMGNGTEVCPSTVCHFVVGVELWLIK